MFDILLGWWDDVVCTYNLMCSTGLMMIVAAVVVLVVFSIFVLKFCFRKKCVSRHTAYNDEESSGDAFHSHSNMQQCIPKTHLS